MAAPVAWKKDHVASGELAGQQIVRRRTEGGFDFHPFLVGEAFDVVKAGAADDANAMIRHGRFIALARQKVASDFPGWRWRGDLLDWGRGTVSAHFEDGHRGWRVGRAFENRHAGGFSHQ